MDYIHVRLMTSTDPGQGCLEMELKNALYLFSKRDALEISNILEPEDIQHFCQVQSCPVLPGSLCTRSICKDLQREQLRAVLAGLTD